MYVDISWDKCTLCWYYKVVISHTSATSVTCLVVYICCLRDNMSVCSIPM